MEQQNKKFEYFAFISYKREDEKWAKWLQKKLESYGFPVALRKENPGLPSKIRPIFRDQSELSGGNLKDEIEKGLEGSNYLIVICSPRSAKSPWVSKEVQYFIDHGRENNIIPFIIGGTPNASIPEYECFPEGLRQLSGERELLGININEMGRDAAAIKVVARMFNLRFDTLWQRHERAKRHRRIMVIASVAVFAMVSFGIGAYMTYLNTQIAAQRDRAKKQTEIAKLESNRANSERDNALKANKALSIAKDSIQLQSTLLVQTNMNLEQANRNLAEEKNHVIKANWRLMENHARAVATTAIQEIQKGNVIESMLALLSVTPQNNEKPYIPEVEYALRFAYDKFNSNEWIYTEMDKYYDSMDLTSNDKYLICKNEADGFIDIVNTSNNSIIKHIDRNILDFAGFISSKDGSSIYLINNNDSVVRYDIETDKYIICNNGIINYVKDLYFPSGISRFTKLLNHHNDNEILQVSPHLNYFVSKKEYISNNEECLELFVTNRNGDIIFSLKRNANNILISNDMSRAESITDVSFSYDEKFILITYRDGHNEIRSLLNPLQCRVWNCGNQDCDHYSNRNYFANQQNIIHTSIFEDKIKIFDMRSLNLVDSINFIGTNYIEGSYVCANKKVNKIWTTQLNNPVMYEKNSTRIIKTDNFSDLNWNVRKEINCNGLKISSSDGMIYCTDSFGKIRWRHTSSLGSLLLGTFDDNRLIGIVDNKPRGADEVVFLERNSGKVVYRNSYMYNPYISSDGSCILLVDEYSTNAINYQVLSYQLLIDACINIVHNRTMTKKGYLLFNILK